MKKVLKIIFISLLFLTLNNAVYAKSELKIGAILPLSGEHELLGNNVYQSILITIFELKNLNIKIIPLDTKSSKAGAINAFQEGINKKVDLFVGPIFYDTLNEIKNIEGFKEKLFISYSNKEENIFPNVINFGVNLSSQINSLDKLFKNDEEFIFFGDNSSFTKKVLEKTKKFKSKNTDVIFYKNFSDIENQTKRVTNYEERNTKHLEEVKKLEQIEDNLDQKLIESMKKHDTTEKVSFNKVFVSSFDDELISSISYFDFYSLIRKLGYISKNILGYSTARGDFTSFVIHPKILRATARENKH